MSAGDETPIVELIDVYKSFGGVPVLRGVTLSVRPKETFVIIGRSGTGKSVLLRHIAGLVAPDSGEVRVFGEDIAKADRKRLAELRRRMGFLFQSGALLNWMSVEENVALPLVEHERKLGRKEVEELVLAKLRLVGMESARTKLPSDISGGMKKRAALARATVLDPDLVLYDEPTSGLDPVISTTINELIRTTQAALGTTQIVVTHDMESAYSIGDRIALLNEGRVAIVATPDELRKSEDPIVQQFIGGKTGGPLRLDG
jgi:phospholipid/cholesterol/gamma-HCH transport system ATP-binding protein